MEKLKARLSWINRKMSNFALIENQDSIQQMQVRRFYLSLAIGRTPCATGELSESCSIERALRLLLRGDGPEAAICRGTVANPDLITGDCKLVSFIPQSLDDENAAVYLSQVEAKYHDLQDIYRGSRQDKQASFADRTLPPLPAENTDSLFSFSKKSGEFVSDIIGKSIVKCLV